ncbi:MAG TPA: hypothetical protein DEF51_53340, partial [Myxococcales bacterium]|nr:hypothetical protein [Myxococcales bacterium]
MPIRSQPTIGDSPLASACTVLRMSVTAPCSGKSASSRACARSSSLAVVGRAATARSPAVSGAGSAAASGSLPQEQPTSHRPMRSQGRMARRSISLVAARKAGILGPVKRGVWMMLWLCACSGGVQSGGAPRRLAAEAAAAA